jgi:DNA (cytosine-5)-methyltransferase 1
MGFDARWGVLGAADIGANHQRDRIWIVAKWRGQLSHAQHDRIGRWEQQQEGLKKEANDSYTNVIHDALQGNSKDYEESVGEWGIHVNRSLRNSRKGCEEVSGQSFNMANTSLSGFPPCNNTPLRPQKQSLEKQSWRSSNEFGKTKHWWEIEPNVGRVADGVAARVDRLKAIGNGQVPLCAATAWRILSEP